MSDPLIINSRLTAIGTASSAVRVLGIALVIDCILSGSTQDILIQTGSIAQVEGDVFDSYALEGTGILESLQSDRAAWDTGNYPTRHAFDIADSTFIYHNDPNNMPLGSSLEPGSFYIGNALGVATVTGISGDAAVDSSGVLTITAQAVDASNVAMTNGSIFIGGADGAAHEQAISGDASISNAGVLSLTTINANVGTYGDASNLAQITVDAKGRITAIGEIAFTGGGQHIEIVVDGLIPANPILTPDGSDFVYAYVSD